MTALPSILRRILETKAEEIAEGKRSAPLRELQARIREMTPCRGFATAIENSANQVPAVIAEVKRASPSAGVIRADFRPAELAASYQVGGASCLSVLTDQVYFQGDNAHLSEARNACAVPVLRKEFLLDPWQIYESRVLGADCVLLIVAALEQDRLIELEALATELGMDVLVEVHNESELAPALETGTRLVGVNNRDLRTFTTDLGQSERLRPQIPPERLMITESGIGSPADVQRMLDAGVDGFLVGEAFMRQDDPGAALRSLFGTARFGAQGSKDGCLT